MDRGDGMQGRLETPPAHGFQNAPCHRGAVPFSSLATMRYIGDIRILNFGSLCLFVAHYYKKMYVPPYLFSVFHK